MKKLVFLLTLTLLPWFTQAQDSSIQYYPREGYWAKSTRQISISTREGEELTGLMLFANQEGIALLPNHFFLTPNSQEEWEPRFILKEDIMVLRPHLRVPTLKPSLVLEGSAIAAGFLTGLIRWDTSEQGIAYSIFQGGAFGFIGFLPSLAAVFPTAIHNYRTNEIYIVGGPPRQTDRQYRYFLKKSRRYQIIETHHLDSLTKLKSHITENPESWRALIPLSSQVKNQYYIPKFPVHVNLQAVFWVSGINETLARQTTSHTIEDIHRSLATELKVDYVSPSQLKLGLMVGHWKNRASHDLFYRGESGGMNGYGYYYKGYISQLTHSYAYLPLGYEGRTPLKWLHWDGYVAPGVEHAKLDSYATNMNWWEGAGFYSGLPQYTRVATLEQTSSWHPSLRAGANLTAQARHIRISLGFTGVWSQSISSSPWEYTHYRWGSSVDGGEVLDTYQAQATQIPLSRLGYQLGVGWRF